MKPIEIHIEGYKITISEDNETDVAKDSGEERIIYTPCPYKPDSVITPYPPVQPLITWNTSSTSRVTVVRDIMTGTVKS